MYRNGLFVRNILHMAAVISDIPARQRPRLLAATKPLAHRTATHLAAAAKRLSGSVLTIAGLGCVDVGTFLGNTIAGWIVTGITVLLLDWLLE